ncbi:YDG/SRA domain-containing protein [Agromyces sp. H66]|uniref:YDG/SRA domain-containing protein n=1 Tax=Agromyces sp. H66 TaxID=2529859 RepID=UPI001B7D8984|nr:YDG/SRA domain-containing protein [Agromyces sp. H66]
MPPRPRSRYSRPLRSSRTFGSIPEVTVGSWFENRVALREAGVHPPNQAGISGTPAEGADSIVLSGGYVDDKDHGDVIIYTGQGGRGANGRQIADQDPERDGNGALITSMSRGLPVRVTRGAKHKSPLSPKSGYAYGGLFLVKKWWTERGVDGFLIVRFRLERLESERDGSSSPPNRDEPDASPPPAGVESSSATPASDFERLLDTIGGELAQLQILLRTGAVTSSMQAQYDAITLAMNVRVPRSGRSGERELFRRIRRETDDLHWDHPELDPASTPRSELTRERTAQYLQNIVRDSGLDRTLFDGSSVHETLVNDTPAPLHTHREPHPHALELTKSARFRLQQARAGRRALDTDVVISALTVLYEGGGRAPKAALADSLNLPDSRVDPTIAALRRIINVDGYEALGFDPDGSTVVLDTALVAEQFQLG